MAAVTIHSNFGVQQNKIFYKVSQETGKVAWHFHLFKNFPQFVVIHTVKGFQVINEAEAVTDFIFCGSKIIVDGDCSHEIKRCLILGKKVMTNLDSILKSRDIADKGLSSQSYGFSSSHVWM